MKKADYILLAFVIGAFLFFQAILVWFVHTTDYDEAVFLDVARNVQRVGLPLRSVGTEGQLYFIHTPLYIYLVTATVSLVGDSPFGVRLMTMLFAIASIIFTYLTVRQRQTAVSGFIAALLLALNTFVAIYAHFITMAVPMMFFVVLAIYWLAKVEDNPSWHYWFGAGIAAALAVMFKELALIFVVAAALYAFFFGATWQKRISQSIWIVLPTIVALAIWTWWGISLDQVQFQAGLNRWLHSASGANNAAGARALQSFTWIKVLGSAVFSGGMTILFFAAIAAYFIWFRRRLPQVVWLLFLYLGIAIGASFLISLKEPRHVISLVPVIAMIIGMMVAWESVWVWVREKRMRLGITAVITFLFIWNISPVKVSTVLPWQQIETWWEPLFAQRIFQSQHYYGLLKETGQYLGENTPPDTVITVVHEGPVIGYYADRPYYFLYNKNQSKILAVLENTDYLVVDHQVFINLSTEEIHSVMTYIETEFELELLLKDAYRESHIYHRR